MNTLYTALDRFMKVQNERIRKTTAGKSALLPGLPREPRVAAKSGFTLVELLVVLAVICILVALLFPVFSRVRENARRTTCMSNLKQIGLGMQQYISDYDGVTPSIYVDITSDPGGSDPGGTAKGHIRGYNWRVQTFSYIKSTEIFRCPSNPMNKESATVTSAAQPIQVNVSYAANYGTGGLGAFSNAVASPAVTLKESEIEKPAETISIAETTSTSPEMDMDDNANIGKLFAGHNGTSNYLFVDGHVKALSPYQTYYGSGNTVRNMWHRDFSPFL